MNPSMNVMVCDSVEVLTIQLMLVATRLSEITRMRSFIRGMEPPLPFSRSVGNILNHDRSQTWAFGEQLDYRYLFFETVIGRMLTVEEHLIAFSLKDGLLKKNPEMRLTLGARRHSIHALA